MEDYGNNDENSHGASSGSDGSGANGSSSRNRWLIGIIAAIAVAILGLGYGYEQQIKVGHLVTEQAVATATVTDLQKQLNTVTDKLNGMVAAQQQAAADAAAQKASQAAAKGHTAAKQAHATDSHYKQLQAQLTAQEKQLKDTQDLVAKNRADLEIGRAHV